MIAERADVAPRTFFRYFPTKESLLFAEFDEVRRDMFDTLESRPRSEAPLRSLSVALCEMAVVIEARRDELVWGFRLCADQQVEGVYERTMLKEQTNTRVAAFIADRLGVDDEVDPRPMAWSGAIMAVFAAAMKFSATDDPGAARGAQRGAARRAARGHRCGHVRHTHRQLTLREHTHRATAP